jgi:predicted secreted hydrolase
MRRRTRTLAAAVAGAAALALAAAPRAQAAAPDGRPPAAAAPAGAWRAVAAPYRFVFPRDHASHPAYATEWWYYTGHLRAGERTFGFQLTFFRVGIDRARAASPSAWAPHTLLFAHAALTDERAGRFAFDERIARPALGLAGADSARYRVWVEDWSAALAPDGRTHALRAAGRDLALWLDLAPLKPPVAHGRDGVSRKAAGEGHASHYYSLTRMRATGRLAAGRDTVAVEGEAWMDHEFMSSSLAPGQRGWDWFSVQLDDGRELMLYRLRLDDGRIEPASSGTLVARDGTARHLPLAAWSAEPAGAWISPRTGGRYPARWTLRVPGEGLTLRLEPTVAGQELVTEGSVGVHYWEGSVRVTGEERGRPLRGRGYVEMTGYAGAPPGR